MSSGHMIRIVLGIVDLLMIVAIEIEPLIRAKIVRSYHTSMSNIALSLACKVLFCSVLHTNEPHIFGVLIQPDYPQPAHISSVEYCSIVVVVTTTILLIAF